MKGKRGCELTAITNVRCMIDSFCNFVVLKAFKLSLVTMLIPKS